VSSTDNAAESATDAYAGDYDLGHEPPIDPAAWEEIPLLEHDSSVAPIKLCCWNSARGHTAHSALRAAAIARWPFRAPRRGGCAR
jgi:hypothetical protein